MKQLFIIIAVIFSAHSVLLAEEPANFTEVDPGQVSRIAHEVSQEIFSPFCPGKTLAMCPSPNASEVRREIQEMARQGQQKEDIKQQILAEYGEEFLLVEPPAGDNLALLTGVFAGLGICIFAVLFITRRRRKGAGTGSDADGDADEDDLGRDGKLDDYLDEIRKEYKD